MPTKSKRKNKSRKPLAVANAELGSPQHKTLDDYFPPSPPVEHNNNGRLEITSETIFYSGPTPEEALELKKNIFDTNCLLTPEDSPEKVDHVIKVESASVPDLVQPSLSEQFIVEESKSISISTPSTSQSHTSNTSEDSGASFKPASKSKSKRRGRPAKVKQEKPQPNHLVTDFFPVRKSSRKTAKELQREQEELMRNKILDDCEDGLRIVHYEGKGRGIEASTPFAKGDFIVEYAGDLVELKEARYREETYKKDTSFGCYMYFFNHRGKSYCIDATRESGKLGRLLNHSRLKPNCVTKTLDIGDQAYLILVAGRDIEVGEELVYDYGDRSKEAVENNPWLRD